MGIKQFDFSCIGKTYNELTITGKGDIKRGGTMVWCKCSCGNSKQIRVTSVKIGQTKSCGCIRNKTKNALKHGLSHTHSLYQVWSSMKKRCLNPKDTAYADYGGRGVSICDSWKNSFIEFYNWAVENGWEIGLQLDKDKLSPSGIGLLYCPEFCCFLTRKENGRYKRNNIIVEYNNEKRCLIELCEILDLKKDSILHKVKRKRMSYQKAFEEICEYNYNKTNTKIINSET